MTTAPLAVQHAEVDGVPVFWVDTPGRLQAHLVFGVGVRDEEFRSTGVTHLVEHLVMRQLDELPHAANAGVTLTFTSFEVAGSPEVVVGHLARLCSVIGELDVAPLALERGVIASEEGRYGPSLLSGWPLGLRFGNRGPGLFGNGQLAPDVLDGPAVLAWCRRWLHRDNAVLVLDGPPPPELTLPLPVGPPVTHVLPQVLPLPTPAYAVSHFPGVLVALYGPWSAELATGLQVLDRRLLRRLRRDAGLVYEIGIEVSHLGDGTVAVGLVVEAADEHVPTVVGHLFDVLDELCADGPTAEELERDRQQLLDARHDDVADARDRAFDVAVERLTGMPPIVVGQQRVLDGLAPDGVAGALRRARGSMVVSVPEGAPPPALPRLPNCPVPPVAGRSFPRALFGATTERGARLVVGMHGLTLDFGRGAAVTVPFADVVGVGVEPGPKGPDDELLVLHAGEGDMLILRARDWRDGATAVAAVRAAVPAELFFATPERMRVMAPG